MQCIRYTYKQTMLRAVTYARPHSARSTGETGTFILLTLKLDVTPLCRAAAAAADYSDSPPSALSFHLQSHHVTCPRYSISITNPSPKFYQKRVFQSILFVATQKLRPENTLSREDLGEKKKHAAHISWAPSSDQSPAWAWHGRGLTFLRSSSFSMGSTAQQGLA